MPRTLISSGSSFEHDIGYSRAVVQGNWVFVSGTTGFDYATMTIAEDVAAQAEQCLRNLDAICREAGTGLSKAIRCTIYLTDLADFTEVNAIYAEAFQEPYPARATVQVAALPKGGRVEIDAVVPLP